MISPIPDDFSDLIDPEEDIEIPEDECCICGAFEVVLVVTLEAFNYPFCGAHDHRATLLQRGKALHWPALRYEGLTGTYALDNDIQAWVLTALQGTDERVCELLDALDEYESQARAS